MKDPGLYSEEQLIQRLRQHDAAAFVYLYDNYADSLNGVILTIINDRSLAGDILQEVFIKIWRHIDQYDASRGRLFTWMHNVARNAAIDVTRRKEWQRTRSNNPLTADHDRLADNPLPSGIDPDLRTSVSVLKEEHKVLVDMSYFQGYTQAEIATMLGIPLGTVKTRLRAALTQLRKLITT
ncbi:MAG TPA: sigma-70 family RNA polymerase sigma factor [Puia sp.]|uniref:RNA polymerase sigma factor n=1 Tax=Puia sp. TaxID=2045100 RepID=UPI002B80C935|nr:sigma-70 family RNA polymerase sigma factor [Puia sp.]HVU97917.1 sigma-70 family RNA polymerase sigma factor [Puia sp.]